MFNNRIVCYKHMFRHPNICTDEKYQACKKAQPLNTSIQWNLSLLSLWNTNVRLQFRGLREFLSLVSWFLPAVDSDIVLLIFSGLKRNLNGVGRKWIGRGSSYSLFEQWIVGETCQVEKAWLSKGGNSDSQDLAHHITSQRTLFWGLQRHLVIMNLIRINWLVIN